MSPPSGYREDIDGLRAIAVLAVVLYHAGFETLSGGFIGVDIFFVISGYLITSILIRDIENGSFSLKGFYLKRIRRILPTLTGVIIFTLIGSWVLFLPSDLESVGKSIIAASLFVSNILFWRTIDYFDTSAEVNPLLHTWSLAVEEQFYIIFPLLLLWCWKSGTDQKRLLIILCLGSFALSVLSVRLFETATFYLLPTRAWELLLGALLALHIIPQTKNRLLKECLSGLGLGLIFASMVFIDKSVAFPGESALPICLGVCLIIYAGTGQYKPLINKLLSVPPMVAIGLISYSLYLWHWPLFIFAEYYTMRDLTLNETLALLIVTFLIAAMSWRYIEQPFRVKGAKFYTHNPRVVFSGAGIAIFLPVLIGALLMLQNGVSGRFSKDAQVMAAGAEDISPMRNQCHSLEDHLIPARETCLYGLQDRPEDLIIWGDSHAVEVAYAIGEKALTQGKSVRHLSHSSCTPSLGYDRYLKPGCVSTLEDYRQYILNETSADTILLIAYYGPSMKRQIAPEFMAAIERNVRALDQLGKRLFILLPVPTSPVNIPRAAALSLHYKGQSEHLNISKEAYLQENHRIISFLKGLERSYENVSLIDPTDALCGKEVCKIAEAGRPLYFDEHHLSLSGARKLAPVFAPLFRE